MQTLARDKYVTSFNPAHPFVYTVRDGETFWVETHDAYKGQISSEKILRPMIDKSFIDCSTGPVKCEGAKAGDVLRVDVLDICVGTQGVMVCNPGMGFCGDRINEASTKIIKVENGFAQFSPQIALPLTPMIGVLGVAPKEGDIHCTIPGDHGSNLDAKVIRAGATVYLPVFIDGAGLAVGDLHACMGDGELSGTAIEIDGKVCLKTTVIKEGFTQRSMVEDEESIYTIASCKDFPAAARLAVDDSIAVLMRKKELSFPDAYRLASAVCDIQVCQVVNALITVRVRIPKKPLDISTVL